SGTGKLAEMPQRRGDLSKRLRRDDLHVQSERAQPLDRRCRRTALPRQDEIGSKLEHTLEIHSKRIADTGNRTRRLRIVAVLDRCHDAIARPRRKRKLGEAWCETHDAYLR